ncbi:MAG: hypothetical protein ACTSP9_06020 [Promethearchaeota archaeon]
MKFRIFRIFRRKTTKTNSKENMNNLGAGDLLEEAVGNSNDGANGSGISPESYDDESKPEN